MFSACSLLLLAAVGCTSLLPGFYHLQVRQGNYLDGESVARVRAGMSKNQVKFVLGSPVITDPFHQNRWDYVYFLDTGGKMADQRRLTLYFTGDTLSRIEREDLPPP
jgi:outer membrane protein assembly factor BamE